MTTRYEVRSGSEWVRCTRATTENMKAGWLHYELPDGTVGIARESNWREAKEAKKKGRGK